MKKTLTILNVGLFILSFAAIAYAESGYRVFYNPPNYEYSSVLSQPIDVLPQGYITVFVNGNTYFYCDGMFYQRDVREQKYVVVPPPIGAVIYDMPTGYQLMIFQGKTFYEYNGVYYQRTLTGFRVIEPPISSLAGRVILDVPYPPSNASQGLYQLN